MKPDALGSNIPKQPESTPATRPEVDPVDPVDLMAMLVQLQQQNAALLARIEKAEALAVAGPRSAPDDDLFPRQAAEPVKRMKVKRVKIVLEANANIPRNGQMFGCNGTMYLLRPGMPAKVPITLIDILNHAVEGKPVVNPDTLQVVDYTQVLRYPYRRVASERELDARKIDSEEAA